MTSPTLKVDGFFNVRLYISSSKLKSVTIFTEDKINSGNISKLEVWFLTLR